MRGRVLGVAVAGNEWRNGGSACVPCVTWLFLGPDSVGCISRFPFRLDASLKEEMPDQCMSWRCYWDGEWYDSLSTRRVAHMPFYISIPYNKQLFIWPLGTLQSC